MKVLITGGYGFTGNRLCKYFYERNAEVHILDNMSSVSHASGHLQANTRLHIADIRDHERVQTICREVQPDLCIHLAAMHYIPDCNLRPAEAFQINVNGTLHILEACASAGTKQHILLSSGAIYADSADKLREEGSLIQPVDIYGLTKLEVEHITAYYSRRYPGNTYAAIRLFNVYGPGETNLHVIPEIIAQLKQGDVLRLGNISPKRDFIHVDDVAEGLYTLCKADLSPGYHCFNLCSGEAFAVSDIINIMESLCNKKFKVISDPEKWRKADKQCQAGNTDKLKTATGFTTTISLKDGITSLLRSEGIIS